MEFTWPENENKESGYFHIISIMKIRQVVVFIISIGKHKKNNTAGVSF